MRVGLGILAAALGLGGMLAAPAAASAIPTFRVTASAPAPVVGSVIDVTVTGVGVSDAYAYTVELGFDTGALEYVANSATAETSGFTDAVVSGGVLTVVHTKLGTSPAASGDFTLATVRFEAVGVGGTEIALRSVNLVPAPGVGVVSAQSPDETTVTVAPRTTPTASSTPTPTPVRTVTVPGPTVTVTARPAPAPAPTVTVTARPAQAPAGGQGADAARLTGLGAASSSLYLKKGSTAKLPVVGYGAAGAKGSVTVTSSKPKVVRVSGAKTLKAGQARKVTIKAKRLGSAKVKVKVAGGKTLTVKVKVVRATRAATRVTIRSRAKLASAGLAVGASKRLKVSLKPAGATRALVVWSSSRPAVAAVDAAGRVTGKSAGLATITAKVGRVKATVEIRVG